CRWRTGSPSFGSASSGADIASRADYDGLETPPARGVHSGALKKRHPPDYSLRKDGGLIGRGRGEYPFEGLKALSSAGGVVVPIGLFMLPYCLSGSLEEVWRGLFILLRRRLEMAAFSLPPAWTSIAALPYTAILACWVTLPKRVEHVVGGVLALILASVV